MQFTIPKDKKYDTIALKISTDEQVIILQWRKKDVQGNIIFNEVVYNRNVGFVGSRQRIFFKGESLLSANYKGLLLRKGKDYSYISNDIMLSLDELQGIQTSLMDAIMGLMSPKGEA